MALSSIPGANALPIRNNPYATADALRTRTEAGRPGAAPARPASLGSPATLGQAPTTLPAEAPSGTDPELWSVLSSDERAFFAKAGALGPLTYGRASASAAPAGPATSRGGRLDVRA